MTSKLFIFIAGCMSSLYWTSLPSIPLTAFVFITVCVIAKPYTRIACLLFGIVWMASVGHWQCYLQLPTEKISKSIWVTGKIVSLIHQKDNIRFNFEIKSIGQESLYLSKKIRLSWQQPSWRVSQGQQARLKVKLKPIHGLANEGGFNYQKWLFSEGIIATGYVKPSAQNILLQATTTTRQRALDKILEIDITSHKWLLALAIGYRGLLQPSDWELVQKTGVAHLIAISGLHLAFVASISYLLIAWLAGVFIRIQSRWHNINLHKWAIIGSLILTFLYSGLAGFALPTLRAWIMLLLFSGLLLCNKNNASATLLGLGIVCFLLFFPLSIFGGSFWLSFSAILTIWFIFWRWPQKQAGFSLKQICVTAVRIQLALSVLMLPIVAWQFSYISVVSPLVNLIAVPVVTFVLVPLCLLAVLCLFFNNQWAEILFSLCQFILDKGLTLLQYFLGLDWAFVELQSLPLMVWVLLMLAILVLFMPTVMVSKKWALILVFPFISYGFEHQSKDWNINVLDVGQGVSVVIIKNHQAILYDVGAKYPSGFNMAESVIMPFLKSKGITSIDTVFISHGDNDHAGSLPILKKKFNVKNIVTSHDLCLQGYKTVWQGLMLEVFWPDDPIKHNDNNGSCVIKVSDGKHSLLLTGDIDKSIEKRLLVEYQDKLNADILLAPHHGSNTSSSQAFIQAVNPKYVVFSQGALNRWGFPKLEVVTRYDKVSRGIGNHFMTSESGQVVFTMPEKQTSDIIVQTFRQDISPYWYTNMPKCCLN